jgi:ABC-type nitrate/sulfonate/bicarbonate transport system substrate-binding protein
MKNYDLLRVVRSGMLAALATLLIGSATLPDKAQAAEPIKVVIGYQSLWAAGGEVVEVLRHTNIFELNGITAEYKTFTFGGPLAEAAVAGDIDNVFAADAPVLRAMARMPGSKILQRTHDAQRQKTVCAVCHHDVSAFDEGDRCRGHQTAAAGNDDHQSGHR